MKQTSEKTAVMRGRYAGRLRLIADVLEDHHENKINELGATVRKIAGELEAIDNDTMAENVTRTAFSARAAIDRALGRTT